MPGSLDEAAQPSARHAPAPLIVDVALMPDLVPAASAASAARRRTIYIVVDVIRATTTLCVQFERGCQRVLVAGSIAAARTAADLAQRGEHGAGLLLAGEVGGVAPSGFDYGNSPAEFGGLDLAGQTIIFATTNGTRALHASAGGAHVLIGSLRNRSAVTRLAATLATPITRVDEPSPSDPPATPPSRPSPAQASEATTAEEATDTPSITVICSGRGGRPAFDDTICAGYLVASLQGEAETAGRQLALGEGARIALAAAESARRTGLRATLAESEAGRAVATIGLLSDLEWCATIDATPLVPAVTEVASAGNLLVVEPWAGPF